MARCYKSAAKTRGQSLIEMVVAIGTISILLVALLSLVSLSLKNTRLAKDRATAIASAQEGVELMRAYRDYDWTTFRSLANSGSYSLPANWVVANGLGAICDQTKDINDFFWRCVRLTDEGSNQVGAEITVGWTEGNQEMATVQTTQLSLWER